MSIFFLSVGIMMSEQVVPSALVQRIIVKYLTNEKVKPIEIVMKLGAQFAMKGFQGPWCMTGLSHLKKAEQRLKTSEEYTFCRGSYDQSFLGLSRRLLNRFSETTTTNHQRRL
jgi:hypothetical protein